MIYYTTSIIGFSDQRDTGVYLNLKFVIHSLAILLYFFTLPFLSSSPTL